MPGCETDGSVTSSSAPTGTFYEGISNALDRRLAMHSQGVASKYTRTRLPVKLVYLEPQRDRASASRRELQIKKMSRARKRALTH